MSVFLSVVELESCCNILISTHVRWVTLLSMKTLQLQLSFFKWSAQLKEETNNQINQCCGYILSKGRPGCWFFLSTASDIKHSCGKARGRVWKSVRGTVRVP